jgi:hypothetical protein
MKLVNIGKGAYVWQKMALILGHTGVSTSTATSPWGQVACLGVTANRASVVHVTRCSEQRKVRDSKGKGTTIERFKHACV